MKTLRSYQQYAVDEIMRKNLLLADDTGLGKTITAIEAIKHYASNRMPALIVVPKTIKLQWYNALHEQGIELTSIIVIDSGAFKLDDYCEIVLIHYEAFVKHIELIRAIRWSLVVLDEGHRIKNRKTRRKNPKYGKRPGEPKTISADTQRTQAAYQLKADRKLLLTATPYDERNPAEVWSLLHWLDPQFFTSYWRFHDAHINFRVRQLPNGETIKEINKDRPLRDPESFARVLRPYVLRRLKKDVRADLPERIDQVVDLEMGADQARVYRDLYEAEINALIAPGVEISMPIALTRILRLIQATTDPALLGHPSASSVKLDWLRDWLEDHPNESVIVFTRFRETAQKIAGWGSFDKLIIGGQKRANVTTADRKIVGTIAAMGEGLDLPWIDYAIFIDCEYSSILMHQAIDRIYRINIEAVKHVYWLQCANTVDQLVYNVVQRKWSTQQLVEQFLIESKGVV